jgi:hypothetical protein
MITFLISVAALTVALYVLKRLNDCQKENKDKTCCKDKNSK